MCRHLQVRKTENLYSVQLYAISGFPASLDQLVITSTMTVFNKGLLWWRYLLVTCTLSLSLDEDDDDDNDPDIVSRGLNLLDQGG